MKKAEAPAPKWCTREGSPIACTEKNKVMNLTGITEYEEVKEFVHAAEKCDFDIDVFYNRIIIDAKSMLGVLSLDLSRELTVKYGGKNNAFENVLCKYACA